MPDRKKEYNSPDSIQRWRASRRMAHPTILTPGVCQGQTHRQETPDSPWIQLRSGPSCWCGMHDCPDVCLFACLGLDMNLLFPSLRPTAAPPSTGLVYYLINIDDFQPLFFWNVLHSATVSLTDTHSVNHIYAYGYIYVFCILYWLMLWVNISN